MITVVDDELRSDREAAFVREYPPKLCALERC
jgi:hypothetical protein